MGVVGVVVAAAVVVYIFPLFSGPAAPYLSHTYTSFINTTSSIANGYDVTSYGNTDVVSENRLIGLSNSTMRSLMWYVYNSGNQSNLKFPYYGKPKDRLPLLIKYHAIAHYSEFFCHSERKKNFRIINSSQDAFVQVF